jgi:hypothetical protein
MQSEKQRIKEIDTRNKREIREALKMFKLCENCGVEYEGHFCTLNFTKSKLNKSKLVRGVKLCEDCFSKVLENPAVKGWRSKKM